VNVSCETQFSYGKPDAGNLHVRFDEGDARASGHLYSTVKQSFPELFISLSIRTFPISRGVLAVASIGWLADHD